jgi:hypothetical protein
MKNNLDRLEKLANDINYEHDQVTQAVRESLEHARKAGALLAQAREQIVHSGQPWLAWLKDHCQFAQTTANNYLRVFRHWDDLPTEGLASLSLRGALAALKHRQRRPKVPPLTPSGLKALMGEFSIVGELPNLLALLRALGVKGPVVAEEQEARRP